MGAVIFFFFFGIVLFWGSVLFRPEESHTRGVVVVVVGIGTGPGGLRL